MSDLPIWPEENAEEARALAAVMVEIRHLARTATREPWRVEEGVHKGDNWLVASFGVDAQIGSDGEVLNDEPMVKIYLVTDSVNASNRWASSRDNAEWCVRAQTVIRGLARYVEKAAGG